MKNRPRDAGHPATPSDGETVSPYTFRHHTVVLRVFARWLRDEGYAAEHRLERLKTVEDDQLAEPHQRTPVCSAVVTSRRSRAVRNAAAGAYFTPPPC